jgi:hypothetical protein
VKIPPFPSGFGSRGTENAVWEILCQFRPDLGSGPRLTGVAGGAEEPQRPSKLEGEGKFAASTLAAAGPAGSAVAAGVDERNFPEELGKILRESRPSERVFTGRRFFPGDEIPGKGGPRAKLHSISPCPEAEEKVCTSPDPYWEGSRGSPSRETGCRERLAGLGSGGWC